MGGAASPRPPPRLPPPAHGAGLNQSRLLRSMSTVSQPGAGAASACGDVVNCVSCCVCLSCQRCVSMRARAAGREPGGRVVGSEHAGGDPGAVDQQQQLVAEFVGVAETRLCSQLAESRTSFLWVRAIWWPRWSRSGNSAAVPWNVQPKHSGLTESFSMASNIATGRSAGLSTPAVRPRATPRTAGSTPPGRRRPDRPWRGSAGTGSSWRCRPRR